MGVELTDKKSQVYILQQKKTTKMADEEKKPEGIEHVNLKVCGQDGSVVQFKIKKNTALKKLMSAYCDRQGLDQNQIRFRFDGTPIQDTDTPQLWIWRMMILFMFFRSRLVVVRLKKNRVLCFFFTKN